MESLRIVSREFNYVARRLDLGELEIPFRRFMSRACRWCQHLVYPNCVVLRYAGIR